MQKEKGGGRGGLQDDIRIKNRYRAQIHGLERGLGNQGIREGLKEEFVEIRVRHNEKHVQWK